MLARGQWHHILKCWEKYNWLRILYPRKIHIKNKLEYGNIYTNERFAKAVEGGSFASCGGISYYVGTDLIVTNISVDFDAETIRSKADKYPYIYWNK